MPVLKYWNGSAYVELSPGNFQPVDSDLTAIAAIAPANDDLIQRKSGVWVNRTLAQLKTDLGVAAANGIASLDGTTKVPIAQVPTAADGVSNATSVPLANDSRLSNARTPSAHNHASSEITSGLLDVNRLGVAAANLFYLKAGGASGPAGWVAASTVKTDLGLVKGDVGLGNVDNTSDANKPVSTATQTALNGKEPSISSPGSTAYYWRGDKNWATLNAAAAGAAAASHTHAAADVASGVIDVARLGASPAAGRLLTALAAGGGGSWIVADKSVVGLGNVDNLQQQPLDADLTAIAGLSTQSYGRNLLTAADANALHTMLGDPYTMAPVRVSSALNPVTLSGTQTIDGVAVVAGDRVLVRWNGPASQNGVYVVAAGAWARAADADTVAKMQRGTTVLVLEGNNDKYKVFTQLKTLTTLGTDSLEWRVHNPVDVAGSLQYPQPLGDGHLFFDRNAKSLSAWESGAWYRLNGVRICTSTTRPIFTGDDAVIFETDTGNAYIFSGGSWVSFGSVIVEDENATPVNVSKLDFQGAGVTVSNPNPGEAVVSITSAGDDWLTGTGVPSSAVTVARTNLCLDPSNEIVPATAFWTLLSNINTVVRNTGEVTAFSGTYVRKIVPLATGGVLLWNPNGTASQIPVSPNTAYTLSFYGRSASMPVQLRGLVGFYDAAGAAVGTQTIVNSVGLTTTTGWFRHTITVTSPALAAWGQIAIGFVATDLTAVYLDAVQFEAAATATAYFDGSTTDLTSEFYDWTGTAHASTSTRSVPVTGSLGAWYLDTGSATKDVYEMTAPSVWTLRGSLASSGGGGTDEVYVGSTAPASTLELWYDTAASAYAVVADTGWIAFPYAANYQYFSAGYSVPGYRKIGEMVYLRGIITRNTATAAAGSICGTLPVGFRPPNTCIYEGHISGTRVRIDIGNNGNILHTDVGLNVGGFFSLDGLIFSV